MRRRACDQVRGERVPAQLWQIVDVELLTGNVPAPWQIVYRPFFPDEPERFEVKNDTPQIVRATRGADFDLLFPGINGHQDRRFEQRQFAVDAAA